MEYFFYGRDNPGVMPLRQRLVEAHWSFMDGYADGMIARGPTLAEDDLTPTGSVNIVDLPDFEAARVFAYEGPNFKAGVYEDVMIRRWQNTVDRKMWTFPGNPTANQRFLVIAHGRTGANAAWNGLSAACQTFLREQDRLERLIVGGPLWSDDSLDWAGCALMLELPSRDAIEIMLTADPCLRAGLYERIEIHRWRFGGRPDGVHVL